MTDERIHKAMHLLAAASFALSVPGEPPNLAWASNDTERALAILRALYDEQRKAALVKQDAAA